ncbi:hypothetical protein BD770DRAFT_406528 [Pilaira anomala]|nr:hypothetical protein BD770DRAFT_406528 [Pilaira anomala]
MPLTLCSYLRFVTPDRLNGIKFCSKQPSLVSNKESAVKRLTAQTSITSLDRLGTVTKKDLQAIPSKEIPSFKVKPILLDCSNAEIHQCHENSLRVFIRKFERVYSQNNRYLNWIVQNIGKSVPYFNENQSRFAEPVVKYCEARTKLIAFIRGNQTTSLPITASKHAPHNKHNFMNLFHDFCEVLQTLNLYYGDFDLDKSCQVTSSSFSDDDDKKRVKEKIECEKVNLTPFLISTTTQRLSFVTLSLDEVEPDS